METGVRIELLGRFRVAVGSDEVMAEAWPVRRAAELVQLLALADGHRLTRDQVVEALWPHLDVEAGGANLRKAAHYARQALASPEAVELRRGQVALFPSRPVETDAGHFEAQARAALAGGDAAACAAAASAYTGDLQASGDADAARDQFRTAAAGFGASGQPLDEARCTALAGVG